VSELADSFASPFFQRALLDAVLIGAITGVIGVHVLLRRLPFFVVAMSHATFPGVVLASVTGVSIFIGGWTFGVTVALLVALIGTRRVLDETSAVGVVLAGSFALGVVVLSAQSTGSRDLSAFLVGSVVTVTRADIITTATVGGALLLALAVLHKELVFGAFDPGGASAAGYRTARLDVVVLLAVTVALVTAVPAVGTLLAVALLTVPAMTARLWSERVGPAMALAAVIGASCGVVGLCASAVWDIAAGGAIALTCSVVFAVSFVITSRVNRARIWLPEQPFSRPVR
jgi:manganese/iron transport system permease protein